jgi:hippurate hydrolase
MGAEDFAYFLQARPGCYVWIGNGLGEGGCMLHNPRYDFNDHILPLGAAYWVRLSERILGPESEKPDLFR